MASPGLKALSPSEALRLQALSHQPASSWSQIAQRSSTAPTVKPAPTDASSTRSPFFSRPVATRVVERERDRRRRRVAEPLDVDDDLARVEAQLLGRRLDDPAVGLVRHEQIEVVGRRPLRSRMRRADLLGLAHRELEDRLPVLLHVVQPLLDGLVRRRAAGCRRPACTAPARRCRRSRARSR